MTDGRRPSSLQVQLALRLGAVFLVALSAAFGGVLIHGTMMLDSLRDRSLIGQVQDVTRALSRQADGRVQLDLASDLDRIYRASAGGYMLAVFDHDGTPLAALPAHAATLLAAYGPAGQSGYFRFLDPTHGTPIYAYVRSIDHVAPGLRVAVAQGPIHEDAFEDTLIEEFVEAAVWWIAPVLFATLAIGVFTIRRSLQRVNELSDLASRIAPGSTATTLPLDAVPREIAPLVSAFNDAIRRLDQALQQQRHFTADAAHALRTPLAVLTARVDAMAKGESSAAFRDDVARMSRLVEQMLKVARLESEPLDLAGSVDVVPLTRRLIAQTAPLAIKRGLDLALEAETPSVRVKGDEQALAIAIENLIENAIAHAPDRSAIEVQVRDSGRIVISDRGPGIAPANRENVFRRFWREPTSRHLSGAGLGLAIVRQVIDAHGGRITVSDRPGGGSEFAIDLPKAA